MDTQSNPWPKLDLTLWQETCEAVHLWSQIVGKIRLSHMPWINHSWHAPLYVTVQGLGTSIIPYGDGAFSIDFDFINHRLLISTTEGALRSFKLAPMSVAEFYRQIMEALDELNIVSHIWPVPVEIPGPAQRFPEDAQQRPYDAEAVTRFWRALLQAHRVFTQFRASFLGKVSPVHFFWGAFDLAVTRFSGRAAPKHPGGAPNCPDWVMEEAYSHEVSSAGFWPGVGLGEAAFYSYSYPEPKGFREFPVQPVQAYYYADLGEFVLPYEAVRTADDPDATLLAFLQTTYEAAANLATWERDQLERPGRTANT